MRNPGDRVHRYTIVTLIGRGGMGEIYEATDTLLERRVALKLIPGRGDAEARERMLREARAAAAFQHPNIVTVFDAGVVDEGSDHEETFMAMEFLRGRTLRQVIDGKDVALDLRLAWLRTLASALGAAHEAGLVHRDIKPDNVMVTEAGAVKVLDFGIAKRAAAPIDPSAPTEAPQNTPATLTQKGSFVGTPRYAPPEQLRGESVDGRSDQYSFGATAFELLTGRPPFDADSAVALLSRILSTAPAPPRELEPEIPIEVSDTILRCLEKEPSARFENMRAVAGLFPPLLDTGDENVSSRASLVSGRPPATSPAPVSPTTTSTKAALPRRIGRWIVRGVLGFAALIGIIILGAIAFGAMTGTLRVDTGTSASPSASSSVLTAPPKGVSCMPADGADSRTLHDDEQALRAIGVGACARLAVELGVPWGHAAAHDRGADLASFTPLAVRLTREGDVVLTFAGVEVRAREGSPMKSVDRAVEELAKLVPPSTEADLAAWGAADAASARRISRAWRKLVIGSLENAEETAKKLVETDPDSPFSHAILALVTPRGSAHGKAAAMAVRARLDKVAPSRAKALEAVAIIVAEPARMEQAIKLLRQSHRDSPNDADVAGVYGAVVLDTAAAEGFAIIERVAADFPTFAHLPLTNAISNPTVRDRVRNAKYLARLVEIQPEKACEGLQFGELVYDANVPELRARLTRCKALFGEENGVFMASLLAALVELTDLEPERARAVATPLLGDPREGTRNEATRLLIASHLLGGRILEAKKALLADMKRLRDEESPLSALDRALTYLRLQTLLGEAPEPSVLEAAEQLRSLANDLPLATVARIDAVLMRAKPGDTKTTDAVVAALFASDSPSDSLYALPLLRRTKSARDALAAVQPDRSRGTRAAIASALDVALLMIEAGTPEEEIDAQLRLAMVPVRLDVTGFDKIAARVILAKRLEARGDAEGAAALREEVARAWKNADPGLEDKAAKLK